MKKGYFYLLLASLSYASMGALVKAISVDTGPFLQTFLRLIVAAVLIVLLVTLRKKPLLLKNPSDYLLILFMGTVGYGLQIIFFTLAIYHTTISNTLFLMSGYPIVTALLAHFFLKEKITKQLLVSLGILLLALFLIFQPSYLGTSSLGNLYALGTCLTFSLYIIMSRIMSKRGNSAETITLWSVAIAVITSGLAAGTWEHITLNLPTQTLLFLGIFGVLNAAAFTFVNKGFATVKASVGTMILMSEPVIGSLLGLFLFKEIPGLIFIIGATLLLLSVYISVRKLK